MQIKEIILQTHLINELKSFYGNILGLEISDESNESFTVNAGSSQILFERSMNGTKPFYHFAFNIPENLFCEAKILLQSRTDLIKSPETGSDEFHFISWNAHSVFFYDPSGNILELIARHNLKNGSDGEFTERKFLCISEIGIPVKSVNKISVMLNETYGIPLFSGDNETFSAMGDDNGLFIIVDKGRKWFPDCPEAKIFPLTVKLNSGKVTGNYSDDAELNIILI